MLPIARIILERLTVAAAAGALLWVPVSLPAQDVLVFPNGDRLSGRLLLEEEGLLHFEHDLLGRISVQSGEVTLQRGDADRAEPAQPPPETALAPELPAPPEEAIPLRRPPWTGRFEFGYTWQSGRAEKNEIALRAQADRKLNDSEYKALGEFLYGQAAGTRNTHRYLSNFRWRESFTPRLFTQTLSQYEADRIRGVRHRAEQNLGVGYRFLKSERLEASIVPGFTVQYTDERNLTDRWDFLASAFQDFTWRFSRAHRFEQDLNFLIDPADTDDFIVRFNAGLVGVLRQNINLSVRYQYLYENETRPGISQTDQRVITSIGYAF
jgi:putative salt-induced outer membrane protein YdiY